MCVCADAAGATTDLAGTIVAVATAAAGVAAIVVDVVFATTCFANAGAFVAAHIVSVCVRGRVESPWDQLKPFWRLLGHSAGMTKT